MHFFEQKTTFSKKVSIFVKRKCTATLYQNCCAGLAPQVGLEPTTLRLTAECSAIELLRLGVVEFIYSTTEFESGGVLLSRAVSSQVPSALRGLTSVFGMGTGGSLSLLSPEISGVSSRLLSLFAFLRLRSPPRSTPSQLHSTESLNTSFFSSLPRPPLSASAFALLLPQIKPSTY